VALMIIGESCRANGPVLTYSRGRAKNDGRPVAADSSRAHYAQANARAPIVFGRWQMFTVSKTPSAQWCY
jgi:hypothetical protein